ncbi:MULTISPECIES: LLM class flavin-dependent oxidoreductase [Microbacterium]|jgi:pyrimidine oxygenase|uniref:LLM class flavin-dependent oxidoreductase n=1 Tax=Microbacterium TaxID=33882 RepID=UPI0008D94F85|nr:MULTISPECIES: LLM class flavin-dependent oxidoreductase [Microbacterium]MAY50128.1 LLM class flavin-dependent oxidoreductase [Microbacterium sp.]HAM11861.1 LLM class flavin-dependent oxidoreductase [Microbacterium sp.]HAS32515.1 LLM class flavin-dependent oxidoreductase [Microbacterium sp.]HBR88782.1 LLM class flavin-dependent oxidoreductase [Microbacterium sp.]HBS75860.1 LLM class flavin-dependent oxidoreductase [Microbacterium sp.]|tara:strand:+ start:1625 stop:2689 length:1065 start_codon:yes stop_codon:yes gene_type:complete
MSGTEYGLFLPNAAGGWLISDTAPYPPADYDYNKRVARLGEQIGLDFVMAMAKWRGFGGATDHWGETIESVTMMAGIAEATERVKIWATIHANMQNPAFAAKVFATLQQISGGRAGLNIVNGSYADEFEQMGLWDPDMSHDERYRMTEEWTRLVLRLWSEDSVTERGEFFTLTDCQSRPRPTTRPTLISAGRSESGRAFQARYADGAFLGAESLEEMAGFSRDVHERAAAEGREVRTYSMLTVVMADTDRAAEERAARYAEGLDREALANMRRSWGWDAQRALSWAQEAEGSEAFQTPYVTGAPETVIERIRHVVDAAELDGLMLIFPDYLEDLAAFGTHVLPALRAAESGAGS